MSWCRKAMDLALESTSCLFVGAIVAPYHLDRTPSCAQGGDRLPNVGNLVATIVIFAVFSYLQGFRIEIPEMKNRFRGQMGTYPVKPFYTSSHAPIRAHL